MSRSASDMYTASDRYTRFTSTSPHASSKPPRFSSSTTTPSSSPSFGSSYQAPTPSPTQPSSSRVPPGPSNESPQEKVARLRAASRLAKSQASMSPLDRAIDRGRRFADKTHRIVAYGLIGFTGIATVISLYAVTDLVIHNRRQKRAWIDRELQRLHDARQAFLRGDPTPEQLHLLEQERAGDEMVERAKSAKERKKRESWWGKGKAMVAGLTGGGGDKGADGAAKQQEDEGRYGRVRNPSQAPDGEVEVLPGERLLEEERWVGSQRDGRTVTEAVRDMVDGRRRGGEKEIENSTGLHGGSLDVLAVNVTSALSLRDKTAPSTGWFSWGKGKDQS